MRTFTAAEAKVISKLKDMPPQTVLKISEACLLHSYCTPLPLFRVYRVDDTTFEAQWNTYHEEGPKQVFKFDGGN
jgi:hypothetical protein